MKNDIGFFEKFKFTEPDIDTMPLDYNSQYIKNYINTIFHLHHFFELYMKFTLEELGINFKNDNMPQIRKKIKINSNARFSSSIDDIEKLNNLRNNLVHNGKDFLRYESLDMLMGRKILPLLISIFSEDKRLNNNIRLSKFNQSSLNLNIFKEIAKETKNNRNYSPRKVAFLKEMARASYQNPLNSPWNKFYNYDKQALLKVKEIKGDHSYKIYICPVCDLESLVGSKEQDFEEGEYHITYISEMKCYCCSFELTSHISEPQKMGYNVPLYWDI
ncbi:hypothetical protein [Alkalicoccobacillus murimartini]|uniref:DUF4145 domain-containing protein n=1 Tax=Alkalicoccobacillus murimartini TaxID=171685 RepID=A0ABT9YLY2_9BACI|nr:hypothetical protein [Alkalicoccobacillus murimartini]MDQ0208865.1 hypothetical protein [Alkalicoccobacillus murimartini]